MAYSRDQLVSEVRSLVSELKKRHDIRAAYLFGSYARGKPGKYSDVDVAIVLGVYKDGGPMDERFEIFHEVQQRNSLFEVLCLTEDEFRNGDMLVVRHIKSEGIRIL